MDSTALMSGAFFVSLASIAWTAAFAWSRWLARPQREPSLEERNRQYQLEQRLAGIEQAVQAIAVEVERLGEGQRYTSRLLTERLPAAAAPRLPGDYKKVDTPH